MKGYCYLDVDSKLNYKTIEYIDTDNPGFWQENKHFILMVWRFDTEDIPKMYSMYSKFRALKLNTKDVLDFGRTIDFQIETLKDYASSLQSNKGPSPFSS